MARLPKVAPIDVPTYVSYLDWLNDYSWKYSVDVHAWVLMTSHARLMFTPRKPGAINSMMQSLGRSYVRYFNYVYKRNGTLGNNYNKKKVSNAL
jgi:putative transposase